MKWKLLVLLLPVMGCTFPNPPSTPDEQWLTSIVMNECKKLGVEVVTHYEGEDREIPGDPYGHPGETFEACMGGENGVVYVYPTCAVDTFDIPLSQWQDYARHECCHVYLGHTGQVDPAAYIAQEQAADQCAVERFSSSP
jgi:hypothetical protein